MKQLALLVFLFFSITIFADSLVQEANDGTPIYSKTVRDSYHKLQFKISIYESLPQKGNGIRLGIYSHRLPAAKVHQKKI